jgi:hypothetical protein
LRRGLARARSSANFGNFRMKQLTVWPMVMLLIVVVLLVIWLRPHG